MVCGALSGCGVKYDDVTVGSPAATKVSGPNVLYRHDFSGGSGGWLTVALDVAPDQLPEGALSCWNEGLRKNCYVPVGTSNGQMMLKSPWYLDPNHAPPGAGYLALLTWVYLRGYAGADTEHLTEIDLRDLTLRASMKSEGLDVKAGALYFWFQMLGPDGRYVNYAYTARSVNALLREDRFTELRLRLRPDPASWTCLGASQARAEYYGCLPLDQAMSHVNADFGFIILPVDELAIPEAQPAGTVAIEWIEINSGGSRDAVPDR
jgi:hypothetical protein